LRTQALNQRASVAFRRGEENAVVVDVHPYTIGEHSSHGIERRSREAVVRSAGGVGRSRATS
jgi:hypothetical protein